MKQTGKRIAIVGNGDLFAGEADIIDLSDLVIRFNDCRSFGAGGTRTDVVAVCNTGRPGKSMLSGKGWRTNEAVRRASGILSVRDPAMFADMREALSRSHPELDDFCDDYTDAFSAFARNAGKTHDVVSRHVHAAADAALASFDPPDYVCPSSGLVVIQHVLEADEFFGWDVVIAGFGHVGWSEHPFGAEKRLVDHWCTTGKLGRISHRLLSSRPQGV